MGDQKRPHEKVIFKQRLEGDQGVNQIVMQEKSIPDRETHQCKGPEAEVYAEELSEANMPRVSEKKKSKVKAREKTETRSLQRLRGHFKDSE